MPRNGVHHIIHHKRQEGAVQSTPESYQGFLKVALIGSKPPPQIKKERVAGLARERQTGNTLFYSFLGRGGESDQLKS